MAQTPEKAVKAKVTKLLKANSIYYFFPATHGFGRSGIPDIICCIKGHMLGIECKAGTNKPTALQEKEMQAIRDAGGSTIVVNEDGISELANLIGELNK